MSQVTHDTSTITRHTSHVNPPPVNNLNPKHQTLKPQPQTLNPKTNLTHTLMKKTLCPPRTLKPRAHPTPLHIHTTYTVSCVTPSLSPPFAFASASSSLCTSSCSLLLSPNGQITHATRWPYSCRVRPSSSVEDTW